MRALWLMIMMYVLMAMSSCRSVRYIPTETIKSDSTYHAVQHRDSIYIKDSIYIDVQRGQDTVYRYETKWRTIYKDVLRVDTFYVTERDSIPYMVEVEKKLNRWEQVKQTIGGYAILLILAFVGIKLILAKLKKGL